MNIEEELKERFKGYHVEIMFFPSGGRIECKGCGECKTDDTRFESTGWKSHKGETLKTAMCALEEKMTGIYGKDWKAV